MNKQDEEKYLELKFSTIERWLERIEKLLERQNNTQDQLIIRVNKTEDDIRDIQKNHPGMVTSWANTIDQRIQIMDVDLKNIKKDIKDRSYIGLGLIFLLIFILIPESREAIVKFVIGIFA